RHVGHHLLGLGPPRALFGTFAVALCVLFGSEAGQDDEATVVGDPRRAAEEAARPWTELGLPAIGLAAEAVGVGDVPGDDLYEHGWLLGCGSGEQSAVGDVDPGADERRGPELAELHFVCSTPGPPGPGDLSVDIPIADR